MGTIIAVFKKFNTFSTSENNFENWLRFDKVDPRVDDQISCWTLYISMNYMVINKKNTKRSEPKYVSAILAVG